MSTFGGFMPEFPHIRVDFFRPVYGIPPPLACFLSHVHSDHLVGLESLKSPFIYCSVATKALLLRLERYPHWINFEKGIFESRKQHFKHLKNLLKPIPLQTPTCIELAPGNDIQVTLFDANHCTGAVMFLIEGDGKAVLYTGDVRAEPWFVNALARSPLLIEYTSGLKTLKSIYLDTSYTEDIAFPTKAEGLAELLLKVSRYPPTTEFHFAAWTFGYEEVWIALSRTLKSQVHVDGYRMGLYSSLCDDGERLSGSLLAQEAPVLAGHKVGNTNYPGILTLNNKVRLHSCDKKLKCSHLGDQTVWIRPIIARTSSGQDIREIGVGGGGGDLSQRPEIELGSDAIIMQLMELFTNHENPSFLNEIRRMLLAGLHSNRKTLILKNAELDCKLDDLPLEELANILAKSVAQQSANEDVKPVQEREEQLPKIITFPYSRHSSYAELRDLVRIFKPMDIYPCTVDKANWHEAVSMRALFGDLCSTSTFRHDQEMCEALPDPCKDETQKSYAGFNRYDSRTSSEDGEYENDISDDDDDDEKGQKLDFTKGLAIPHTTLPKDMHNNNNNNHHHHHHYHHPGEQGMSAEADTTSVLSKACSDLSCSMPAQSLRPSPKSEARLLRRKASLDENDQSSRKRACQQKYHASVILPVKSESKTPEPAEGSQPAIAGVPGVSYYDTHDHVYRCEACGWEFWRPKGACTGCGAGESAYYEVTSSTDEEESNYDPKPKPKSRNHNGYPRICFSSNAAEDDGATDAKAEERTKATGNYLDGATAYDSASSSAENEYEMNSFIDDSIIDAGVDEHTDASVSDDVDYKAQFERLASVCRNLEQEHEDLVDEHESFKRDILGSDYDDSEDQYEPDFDVVNVEVQDPPISEVVLSHVQGDSQSSAVSISRLRTRANAFLAAPEGWHNISLMSTGDNHTEESQEL